MRLAPALVLLALLLLAPAVAAHGGGAGLTGDSLARATLLGAPPARVYETLDAGEAHYHRFTPPADDPLRLRAFAPHDAAPEGLVLLILFGPDLPNDTPVPEGIERPPNMGALVFPANGNTTHVDARIPARRILLLERELNLTPHEHILVLLTDTPARIALFLETDRIAWVDTLLLPGIRAQERDWNGIPPWTSYATGALGAALLAPLALRRRRRDWPLLAILGLFAATLLAANTTNLLADAIRADHLPTPLLAGSATLTALTTWAALTHTHQWIRRLTLATTALAALTLTTGYLWAPVAALAGAVLPEPSGPATREKR